MKKFKLCHVIVVSALSAASTFAQTPDITQLRAKMQQLEQMMQELQLQIAAVEQSQKTPGAPVAAATPRPAQAAVAVPQIPTDHIGEETRLRETASDNSAGVARINNEVMDPALRGFFRLPGTGTLVKMGGFVKTDVFVDANQAGTYYGAYVPSSFPSSPQPHTVNATVSMRPSRFFTEFRQPVEGNETGDTVK